MRNLEKFLLISSKIDFRKWIKLTCRPIYILPLIFQVMLFSHAYVYADTCVDCHTNPQYKKQDIEKLKKCLTCHGIAGHPYKDANPKKGVIGTAEAADKEITPDSQHSSRSANQGPDLKDMVLIPAGEFIMGTDDRLRDEKPLHVVYINSFSIDKFEVTNEAYKIFVDATGHPAPDNWKENKYPAGKGKHSVIFVDWNDANAYCRWSGKRLPRETEWEKAARGADGRIYPWGNTWDMNKSNNPLRGHEGTMPVGSFENGKSPYGLYDMSGNVWEWVDDYYVPHPGSDYVSPEFGTKYRMLKGGSWWDCSFYSCGISAPVFNRAFFAPSTRNDSFGFRCVSDAQ